MTDVNPSVGTPGSPGFYTQFAEPVETFVDEAGGNGEKLARKLQVSDRGLWVSPNGSDSNDGLSGGTAKLTIPAALTAAASAGGGTISLLGGTYDITASLTSTTPNLKLTAVKGAFIRAVAGFPADTDMLFFSTAANQVVSGLKLDGNSLARWGIRTGEDTTNALIEDNEVFGCVVGIRHGSGTGDIIRGNTCHDNTGQGIVDIGTPTQDSLFTKIIGNTCYENGTNTAGNLGWGINVSTYCRRFVVAGNTCHDNYQGGITVDVFPTGVNDVLQDVFGSVMGNICSGFLGTNASSGINLNGVDGLAVVGNIIENSRLSGMICNGRDVAIVANHVRVTGSQGINLTQGAAAATPAQGEHRVMGNTFEDVLLNDINEVAALAGLNKYATLTTTVTS